LATALLEGFDVELRAKYLYEILVAGSRKLADSRKKDDRGQVAGHKRQREPVSGDR
jgi:hypothetical protein